MNLSGGQFNGALNLFILVVINVTPGYLLSDSRHHVLLQIDELIVRVLKPIPSRQKQITLRHQKQ